jgi:hypothetical protein
MECISKLLHVVTGYTSVTQGLFNTQFLNSLVSLDVAEAALVPYHERLRVFIVSFLQTHCPQILTRHRG